MSHPPAVLAIGGLDPTGLAGLAADLRAGAALRILVSPVASALTVQGSNGVRQVQAVDPNLLRDQLRAVFDSLPITAVKIGLLPGEAQVRAVVEVLEEHPRESVILDPVLGATLGGSLVQADLLAALKGVLMKHVTLLTPNVPEAEALLGHAFAHDRESLEAVAKGLLALGAGAVLLKGGHLEGDQSPDLMLDATGKLWMEAARVETANTRGTGCTLATLIAGLRAGGQDLRLAAIGAKEILHRQLQVGAKVKWPQGAGAVGVG